MKTDLNKLLRDLREPDWWSRQRVITGLIALPEDAYVEFIKNGVRNHDDAAIRNASIEVFRALGTRGLPYLRELSTDADPEVRLFTANILCGIRDRAALPLLATLLEDPEVNVRIAAAEALGKTGDAGAIEALDRALSDEMWVVAAAINALGDIGGRQALKLLYDCLEKKGCCPEITISAIERAGTGESIKHLAACFEHAGLREAALNAIITISEREDVRPQPEYFMSLIPMLIGMLKSTHPEIRKNAFIALSWSRDIMGLPYLIEGIKDEELQEYALEGLLNIGRKGVCSIVDEMKGSAGGHRVMLAKVLNMIGEEKALLQFSGDDDPEVRTEVALALGSLDMRRAVAELRKMIGDEHEEVRLAAGKSLVRQREKERE